MRLSSTLALFALVLADFGSAATAPAKTSTTTTTNKPTSTLTSSPTSASAAATQPATVATSLATTLNPSQALAVQSASSQIQNALKQPQCAISGGRLLFAYFQTNQSSYTVPAQCGALCKSQPLCNSYALEGSYCRLYILPVISILQSKLPGNNTFYDRACATSTDMCAINGLRSPFSKSYSSSTKIRDNNFKGCQTLCKASSGCQAFSVQLGLGGSCQLYKNALYKDFLPDSSNLNIYWDVNCPATVPGALNAAPTIIKVIPPTSVPTIANATQAVTFAPFVTPSALSTNDPPYTPTGAQPTPDDDNIFEETYTYDQYTLPPVSATGSPPITTGLDQPTGTALPSAPCMVSAGPQAPFTVLNQDFLPMVSRTGSVGPMLMPTVQPAPNDPILNPETLELPTFYFQPSSSGSNVYDLMYSGSSPQYVAMHSNGSILLTSASTGTSFVNNLVTSIFSFDCYGRVNITQGGASYNLITQGAASSFVKGPNNNNLKALPANLPAVQAARARRGEYRVLAQRLQKRSDSDGPAPKCPASPPGLLAKTKYGYVQGEGNFCDSLSDWWQLSPWDFDGSCAVQSACYDSCEDFGWQSCNGIFGTLMILSCWADVDSWWDIPGAIACTAQASYFTGVAATSQGRELFYKAQHSMCRCFCSSPPDTCAYSETNFYCADLLHGKDNNNCGACGRICGPNSACRDGGVCGCPKDQCGDQCLDFRNNPNNCGSCGNVCNPKYCVGGQCYAPKPGECAPDQGISNSNFLNWAPTPDDWSMAAYPGCSLGDSINFSPTAYTGANGQTIYAVLVGMTNLPGSGCQAALTQINAKMCAGITYELTFTMGAVNQVNGQNVNDNADCSVYWSTGPPNSPGNNGAYQTSPTYTIKGNSQTFQTFGPWGPIHVSRNDPGVEFHHGNLYVNMTAVISCGNAPGGSGYFIVSDVELNPVGTAKRDVVPTIGERDFMLARDKQNSTGFNVTQALQQPYVPKNYDVVVVSSLKATNATKI